MTMFDNNRAIFWPFFQSVEEI